MMDELAIYTPKEKQVLVDIENVFSLYNLSLLQRVGILTDLGKEDDVVYTDWQCTSALVEIQCREILAESDFTPPQRSGVLAILISAYLHGFIVWRSKKSDLAIEKHRSEKLSEYSKEHDSIWEQYQKALDDGNINWATELSNKMGELTKNFLKENNPATENI